MSEASGFECVSSKSQAAQARRPAHGQRPAECEFYGEGGEVVPDEAPQPLAEQALCRSLGTRTP